ncbi:MAG TPA: hypothetical protein VHZ95_19470, partial [Polyangiales bacterium]|nr:hypothetical protein [Polyangiales bacterium]
MSVLDRLRAVRVWLATGVVVRGLVWGMAAAASLVIGAALVDLAVALPLGVRHVLLGLAVVAGLCVAVTILWRDRTVLSLNRVALWVEERFPSLEYRLITAIETGDEKILNESPSDRWSAFARRRAVRVLGVPFAAAV